MEIWLHICKQLCSHCQCGPTESPRYNYPRYQQEKSSLAALSITCRAMAEISQPVLYHFFCQYPGDAGSKFLRTLVSQPQLARHIRVLRLMRGLINVFSYDERREVNKWHELSVNLGVQTPGWVIQALSEESPSDIAAFDGPNQESVLRFEDSFRSWWIRSQYRSWKQLLILGICSTGLTSLDIPGIPVSLGYERRNLGEFIPDDRLRKPFNLQNLRLFSCQETLCIEEFPWFFSQAPLLKRLAVPLASFPHHQLVWNTPSASLENVTTLSVVCGPSSQKYVFDLCRQVRDLEFSLVDDRSTFGPSYDGQALWPASTQNQLRRLWWSAVTPGNVGAHFGDSYPPLLELKNLEILEIDRRSFNVCLTRALGLDRYGHKAAKLLPTVLPRSLRILHFSLRSQRVTLSTLLIELKALAAAKKTTTPMLSLIQIDDFVPLRLTGIMKPYREVMDALGVFSAMKKAGIELRMEMDPVNWPEGRLRRLDTRDH